MASYQTDRNSQYHTFNNGNHKFMAGILHLLSKLNLSTFRSDFLSTLFTDFRNYLAFHRLLGFKTIPGIYVSIMRLGIFGNQTTEHLSHYSTPPDRLETMSSNIAFA